MSDRSLHAQAAVDVGTQELIDPASIVGAGFRAVFPIPESNYGNEASFLFGDHDDASGESFDIFHGATDGGRDGGLHFSRAAGSGDEFNA